MLFTFVLATKNSFCQFIPPCYLPGYTPSTATLICGSKPYIQGTVIPCEGGIAIPRICKANFFENMDTTYKIYSPVYFKFKCYKPGTLGFIITPNDPSLNLCWQFFDVTGKDPDSEIFSSASLTISGYWYSRNGGQRGAVYEGTPYFLCLPIPPPIYPREIPKFLNMPTLVEGHDYLLMVATAETNIGGFRLDFQGGTADITDPIKPKLLSAKPECSGNKITVKINKKMVCESLSPNGSQFRILSTGPAVVSATPSDECTRSNVFDEVTLTLSAPLTDGNYQLVVGKGNDRKILRDVCDNNFPDNETIAFEFTTPKPILADSIGKPACTPDSVKLYFPKKINCSSISANGSDFSVNGPQALTIISASGKCINGKTEYVSIKFDKQITTKGIYQLTLKGGDDGSPIVDECGLPTVLQTINFTVADTVDAEFNYTTKFGCQRDTLSFSHDGAHDANNWRWIFNKSVNTTQSPTIIFPAKSTNDVKLFVSNGTCIDSAIATIKLDNEVKAAFSMTDLICPEDKLEVLNETVGVVDKWRWNYDIIGTATAKDPQPFLFPALNKEAYYSVKLVAFNDTYKCSDSIRKTLTVLDHCLIGVATGFTPNNDGLNDYFSPHNALKADNLIFKIYNRFGQLVFQSKTWRDKWDGKMNGLLQPTGVYIWMLSYTNRDTKKIVFQKGTVTLIR